MDTLKKPSNINFTDAINYYYKLKRQYEKPHKNHIDKLLNNDQMTLKEKQEKAAAFKSKCISCGSLGGTIFKQEQNILSAQCGNTQNPCKINIKLQKGKYDNIVNIIVIFLNQFYSSVL